MELFWEHDNVALIDLWELFRFPPPHSSETLAIQGT